MPTQDEAAAELQRLAQAWFEASARAKAASHEAAGLMTVMRGYVQMFPELTELPVTLNIDLGEPVPIDGAPRGTEAVRLILQDEADRWWLVSNLVKELKSRGWLPESDNPANAVRTALERLVNTDSADVYKGRNVDGRVMYVYLPDHDRDGNRPSPPSRPTYDYGEEPF